MRMERSGSGTTLGQAASAAGGAVSAEVQAALVFFGPERVLTSVRPSDVQGWLRSLGPRHEARVRRHRVALGRLYRKAQELGWVPAGFDPSSVYQHLVCPGDQVGITDLARTYRARAASRGAI